MPNEEGEVDVIVGTSMGARVELEDINRMNRDMNLAMLRVERGEDYAQLNGYATCRIDWPMDKQTYDKRAEGMPWPVTHGGTISPTGWPEPTTSTIVTATHPTSPVDTVNEREVLRRLDLFAQDSFSEGTES